ncbi:hypothetical protein PV433_30400 [Paenibacillus sp. GYB004]|uniref:hypothetical protein n=1 Tax=Paenibacillus sp. GYB004 TaxID=2994393 RepID=UPI002F96372B
MKTNTTRLLPAEFRDDRILIRLVTRDGVPLQLLTDTGGGLVLTEEAVRKAGLVPDSTEVVGNKTFPAVDLPFGEEDETVPPLLIGGRPGKFLVMSEPRGVLEGLDGLIGQAWFADRVWVFDYILRQFIYDPDVIAGGAMKDSPHTVPLGFLHNDQGSRMNSFPRIQVKIDGEVVDLLFDTGASIELSEQGAAGYADDGGRVRGTSFITLSLFQKWKRRNPDWRVIERAEQHTGLPVIEVPEVEVAGYTVGPVWFTARPDPNFHTYISQWMDRRVEGALGGSCFRYFRITAHFPEAWACFER